jgi:hypothetical protein
MFVAEKIFCIIFTAAFLGAGWLILWIRFKENEKETKCPQCKQLWAAENLDDELLGIFRKNDLRPSSILIRGRGSLGENETKMVWYGKYKIYYRCKYCGYEWTSFKSRRL